MIRAAGVSLRYPDGTLALQQFDLEIEPGELVFITGPSGSGKTSLLKLMIGIELPTTGSLTVLGQAIAKNQQDGIRQLRREIGPVFQEFNLFRGRNALDNVLFGLRFLDIHQHQLQSKALQALERVGLEHRALATVDNLSQGERQRVSIARAVARHPQLILADEPTANLDQDNAIQIMQLLSTLQDGQTTVIITTHATHLLPAEPSYRLLTMEQGKLQTGKKGLRP